MDIELDVKRWLPDVGINIAAIKNTVKVERKVRVITGRYCFIITMLPSEYIPDSMVIELMHISAMWWNALPAKSGTFQVWSPREIMS